MADFELVEKLRERASVTYDEAREALDACNDDLLDAVIYLEKKGKVPPPNSGGSFNSKNEAGESTGPAYRSNKTEHSETFSSLVGKFFKWVGVIIKKSCVNMFEVRRGSKLLLTIPVIALVLFILCCFWVSIPLLIIGMFFDCRYKFRGPETENLGINEIIEEVANAADNLKNEVKNAQQSHKDKE